MRYGNGNYLVDRNGHEWLDMLSGILNVSLGHCSEVVNRALGEVASLGVINTYDRPSDNAVQLVELLKSYGPARFEWKLLNTGSEAIERAIQIASVYFGRPVKVAVLKDSFHGKSLSLSCARYQVQWGNPLGIITIDPKFVPTGDIPDFDVLLYEPIRGWDGAWADETRLRYLCDKRKALLVADEMITGFMRCARRFMSVTADMIVSGKGLAQGAPLAVLGITEDLVPYNFPIGWNTTCGGNNLSATIGLRVLEFLLANETTLEQDVLRIQNDLYGMGFEAYGALGFKRQVKDGKAMRKIFEEKRVILSWHDPHIRIGPSFITTKWQLDVLREILARAES